MTDTQDEETVMTKENPVKAGMIVEEMGAVHVITDKNGDIHISCQCSRDLPKEVLEKVTAPGFTVADLDISKLNKTELIVLSMIELGLRLATHGAKTTEDEG